MSSQPPHVLLVSFPLQGHVNPLLRLGARLAAKGLLVTFTTFRHAGIRALREDGACVAAAGRGRLRFDYLRDDGCGPRSPVPGDPSDMLRHVADAGPSALAGLLRRQADAGRPVACVVNNPFVPWALDVAGAAGIPCATLWIQSCAVLSLYYHFYRCPEGFPTEADTAAPVAVVPGLPTLAADELPLMVRPEHAGNLWGQTLRAQLAGFRKNNTVAWVLVNTFEGLERPVVEALRSHAPVTPVGPLLDHDHDHDGGGDDGCMAWLDAQPPGSVVYVAFGSLVTVGCGEMLALAEGLAATGRPFLWVVRDDSRRLLPDGALAACGGRGRVVAWCPQGRVLRHGAVGCFVTHCGWNSVAEALAAGVPMVGYPWWSDQFTNAKLLAEEYGVGVRLPAPATRDAVRACVHEVMGGPRAAVFRMAAKAWKDEAAAAVADGGSSDRNLHAFVQEIRRFHETRAGGSMINSNI
ncbi:Limonoid UDP-glucosyltransferase [Zea mays]|jgi:gallate 1-beta-glucosyltransferase|uniref:Glycosyltransferase n=2 Tax=Zea mays TaxID=4577 RepID=B6UFB5_MAIZE|nr:indole-3-acetate beta-glucosyltransferase [Zea mays]ACG48048.1 indole-3-acetate beta-glucosyltransferase [Zea mays]AQK91981.1 Indole-3-acetate beta-glucosyltransferase [Zea mays]PWZ10237.1 Limonoid UDP-glucosyltransferase [Zea mays]|eukprot:NP_001152529.1 indole-3-acetate beta-glucosyltransferase [Zea mays]